MATLIICPACGTRYETKAVFPPEGRKVRCSKCAHVWQAFPVQAAPAVGAPDPAPGLRPPVPPASAPMPPQAPPPPPRPAAVNAGMGGFAGIAPAAPAPPRFPPPPVSEAELAAQVARINAEAMAEEPPAAQPEKRGGIFSRLTRKREPEPPAQAGLGDAFKPDAGFAGDASMDEGPTADAGMGAGLDAAMSDAGMSDAGMSDAGMGIDAGLAEEALPSEQPPRKGSRVTMGWLLLLLVVAGVIGTLALAPSTVLSVLPGASRLYALFGMPVGARGLALESVRYGWTSDGGLEVQGDVVNLTSSPVAAPTVVIALRDQGGEEISEWTTEIGEEQLAGGQRAPFLRQIPSPPSNVRSVAVRFAKAK